MPWHPQPPHSSIMWDAVLFVSRGTASRRDHQRGKAAPADLQECLRGAEEEKQRNAAAEAAEEKRLAPYRKVAKHIVGRGYRVTRPQFGLQATGNLATPHLDGEGLLHFPMLLFYPEAHPYHDTIEDCCETDVIGDHLNEVRTLEVCCFAPWLDPSCPVGFPSLNQLVRHTVVAQVFGEGAPALPWDEAGQYSRARVRLYYCAHAGTVMKEGQLVDALQGKWPSNYVELGTQVRTCSPTLALVLPRLVGAGFGRACGCRGTATKCRR